MKILIVSDTHGRDKNYLKIVRQTRDFDMVIHLGDVEYSEDIIREAVSCPVEMVAGNNDFFGCLPLEKRFKIGKYNVMMTHGHRYYISMGSGRLKREAAAKGVDIVMYGHTHEPVIDISPNIIAINPGSLTFPRQENRKPSYIIMEIDEKGEARFEVRYVE